MKTAAFLLVVCFVAVFAEDPIKDQAVSKDLIKACLTENGFDAAQYPAGLRNAKVPENMEQKRNCYYACMMKKMNLMKTDGALNEENLRSKFSTNLETLNKAIDTCKAQGQNDFCKLASCMMANREI
ncbi:uncharacterized protein LOC106649244 [Trichogramma pretiosum]|uniref:Uncharacterized protein n=2 Tax=Trichogramma TaxID=7490 RepID=A0ABD2XAP0_9HYME|nr:uncharacterized protein LOC106649244 [Trichogramma pretiosum]ANG08503.1 odorant-binding protein 13 [Trichogramma dendrolimi]